MRMQWTFFGIHLRHHRDTKEMPPERLSFLALCKNGVKSQNGHINRKHDCSPLDFEGQPYFQTKRSKILLQLLYDLHLFFGPINLSYLF